MAHIYSFTLCDSINNQSNQTGSTLLLANPQIALRPQFIPGNFSFGISFGISDIDISIANHIIFTISNPSGKTVFDSGDNELLPAPSDDNLPNEYKGFMICFDIRNLPIEQEGVYKLQVCINGTPIGEKDIPIFKKTIL